MLVLGLSATAVHKANRAGLNDFQGLVRDWSTRGRDPGQATTRENVYATETARIWELTVETINKEETGYWTTEVRALEEAASPERLLISLTMRIESGDPAIRPLQFRVNNPHLLWSLRDTFDLSVSGEQCPTTPEAVNSKDRVEQLVAQLSTPSRKLPLVVVSETEDEDLILPDLDLFLTERLCGLARVVRLSAFQARQLTNRLGPEMSCFHGGVRLYWPSWTPQSSIYGHPLYTRFAILRDTEGDTELAKIRLSSRLARRVARATVASFLVPDSMSSVIEAARRRDVESTPVTDLAAQCKKLLEQVQAKDATISVLERRIAILEDQAAGNRPQDAAASMSQWDYSVPEALAAARIDFSNHLFIPESLAVDGSISGGTIYYFLKALRDLCEEIRSGRLDRNPGDALRSMLAQHGISQGRFKTGDTGVFARLPDGTSRECRYRYHLRSGSPSSTESVYWADYGDENANRVFAVASIGLHA